MNFHEWLEGSWAMVFSHPADYTPVCTTELAEVARCSGEFKKRGVKVAALSCDSVESHKGWIKDVEAFGNVTVDYPIIADEDRKVAKAMNMLPVSGFFDDPKSGMPKTVRSVFLFDNKKLLRMTLTYPPSCGRNFVEILRVIDSV